MCVIIYQPEGKTVPREYLVEGAKINSDGWGIIGQRKNKNNVIVTTPEHGLTMTDFPDRAANYAGHEALFHCRRQSKGVVDILNAHPYKIKPQGGTSVWMMHNGTMNIPLDIDSTRSDTWHFARFLELIPNLSEKLKEEPFVKTIKWIAEQSKLAFYCEGKVTLVNELLGTWRDGCWYSNLSAFPVVSYVPSGAQATSTAGEVRVSTALAPSAGVSLGGANRARLLSGAGGLVDEVTLPSGETFRFDQANDLFVPIRAEASGEQQKMVPGKTRADWDARVEEAIDYYVYSETEPKLGEIVSFTISRPEIAAACLHRLMVSARKFALLDGMEATDDEDEEEEDDGCDFVPAVSSLPKSTEGEFSCGG